MTSGDIKFVFPGKTRFLTCQISDQWEDSWLQLLTTWESFSVNTNNPEKNASTPDYLSSWIPNKEIWMQNTAVGNKLYLLVDKKHIFNIFAS